MMCRKWGNKKIAFTAIFLAAVTGICGCGDPKEESSKKTEEKVKMVGEVVEEADESPWAEVDRGLSEGVFDDSMEDFGEEPVDEFVEEPMEEFTEQIDTENREKIYLEGEDLYKVNIFLSNFAEQRIESYDCDHCSDYELISFAYFNTQINNYEAIQYFDLEMGISLEDVNEKLERYLGKKINAEENEEFIKEYPETGYKSVIKYRDGFFRFPASDGEAFGTFAVATDMEKLEDGTYEVDFEVYTDSELNTGGNVLGSDYYYYYTAEDARNHYGLEYQQSGTALLEPYQKGNIDSYHLLEYWVD